MLLDRLPELATFINEREAVRMRKAVLEDYADTGVFQLSEAGRAAWITSCGVAEPSRASDPHSWSLEHITDDPVLRQYRFCNVRREDDRVTRWIREHIIVPYWDHPNLWIMLCIARQINWPETLAELLRGRTSWPWFDDFSPRIMGDVMQARKERGEKVYTGAYMIRAESDRSKEWFSWTKQAYIAQIVIGRLWQTRDRWEILLKGGDFPDDPLKAQEVWGYFQSDYFIGWGPFLAGQAVTDLKHTRYLEGCPDWDTWTALGPGSARGLNRFFCRPVGGLLSQAQGLSELVAVKAALDEPGAIWPWLQPMELADTQNVFCEWDKYQRVRLNQGKTRARYVPGRGY